MISCKDQAIADSYIGSTNDIRNRVRCHKSVCHNESAKDHNMRVYRFIRANGGWTNWEVTVLEEFYCDTRMEKTRKERSVIQQVQPTLNQIIPANHQTGDLWDKVAYHKAYGKIYCTENKEAIIIYQKERRKKYIHCQYCNHMINLACKTSHYKSNKHINNLAIQNNINEIYQEIKQIYDANVLVLERINSTMLQIQEMVYVRKCS